MSKKFGEKHTISGVTFDYQKGEFLTVSIGDKTKKIKKTDLWMLVFMMSKGKTQDDLIPVWEKEMMQFTRQHQIKVTRDVKAGEYMKFHCDVNVPKIVVASILKDEGAECDVDALKPAESIPKDTPEEEKQLSTQP